MNLNDRDEIDNMKNMKKNGKFQIVFWELFQTLPFQNPKSKMYRMMGTEKCIAWWELRMGTVNEKQNKKYVKKYQIKK